MTDYKPGDRVRVSFEAEVKCVDTTLVGEPWLEMYAFGTEYGVPLFDTTGAFDTFTVEKITPDYKAQIEALEPGTAFVLTTGPIENTYLRIGPGLATKYGVISTVDYILELHGQVDALRILK